MKVKEQNATLLMKYHKQIRAEEDEQGEGS